jgi:16S rRNA (guanine527-N7)-methyltransferase
VKPYWIRAAEFAGLDPSTRQIEQIGRYRDWLTSEGLVAGGIGPSETTRIDRRHLADSVLFATQMVDVTGPVWDLGSGVGLPGIPLAIVLPGLEFVLLDRSGRRVDLMKRVVRILELDNCSVVHGDISDLRPPLETVVSRASLSPARLGAEMNRLLGPAGVALAAGSWEEAPAHPGWVSIEIPRDVLDQTVWLLMMRRE